MDADREVPRQDVLRPCRVGRASRHVDRVARADLHVDRFARILGRRRVDLPSLPPERLEHEHVVGVLVEIQPLGARRRDVGVHLTGMSQRELQVAAEPRDRLGPPVEALEDDRGAVTEEARDPGRVGDPRDPIDAEVGPGDTIYLPAGTPHAARAQDVLSGHLTVGVHVTPWADVLTGVMTRTAERVRDLVPAGWTEDVEGFARELGERLESLAKELQTVDVRAEAEARRERFLSNRPQLARGTIAERSTPLIVEDATVVRRRDGSVCELTIRDDVLVVLLGDRRLEMPAWVEQAMRRIAGSGSLTVADLAEDLPGAANRALLVGRLIREGLLTAQDPG